MKTRNLIASLFMLVAVSAQAQVSRGYRAVNLSVDPKSKKAITALATKRIKAYENAVIDSVMADENSCSLDPKSKTKVVICEINYSMDDRWNGTYTATMELDENGKIMNIATEEFEGSY